MLRYGGGGGLLRKSLRWARRVFVLIVAALALLPWIYRVPGVRPVSTLMIGQKLTGTDVQRIWTPIGEMAPALVQSVMMSEDGQYCSHSGVDWGELSGVIDDAMEGERTRGASTIAMQTAKNLYLWSGRSFIRKAAEVPLAVYNDFALSKKRQMEIYLNIAEWGPGIFGAEAAARYHFGKYASELTAREAALLAVTLPNPHLRNPAKPSRGLLRLARVVEARARQSGAYIGCVQ
jgi:monofunctional biosynthetic peptidoglycan transglycosylase